MIQMSPAAPGAHSFGGGQPYGAATGRTASFGYGSLEGGGNRTLRGPMPMSPKLTGAPAQLLPDQPIGIQAAPSQSGGGDKPSGGGGGLLGRGLSFLKGIAGGGGAAEGAAGAGEAAGAVGAVEELAPLALLA
jgi:type IV secretion system protein TrbL